MALTARYLADKSALARLRQPAVARRLHPMFEEGLIASCALVDMEVLYSCRGVQEFEEVLLERRSLDRAPITDEVMAHAVELQRALARKGQHRLPLPDVIISAAARHAGLSVLHYDADFELLAAAGGADHEWVVPRGSLRG